MRKAAAVNHFKTYAQGEGRFRPFVEAQRAYTLNDEKQFGVTSLRNGKLKKDSFAGFNNRRLTHFRTDFLVFAAANTLAF